MSPRRDSIPSRRPDLDQLIQDLAQEPQITFVVVTHELPSIETIADRVIMLDEHSKKIIAQGKPEALRDHSENPCVRAFFNREAAATVS